MTEQSSDDVLLLLHRAWPAGVPATEMAHFSRLSPERAEVVVKRLRALLDLEDPSVENRAAFPMGRSAAFALRRRWKNNRSIAAINPYEGDLERKTVRRGGTDAVAATVQAVVDQSPGFVSDGDLAREVVRRAAGEISYDPALVLVRDRRRSIATAPDALRAQYGRMVVIDCCAIDVPITGTDYAPAVAALVLEKASGLVIGAATGLASNTIMLQRAAVAEAIELLQNSPLDRRNAPTVTGIELTSGTSTNERDLALQGQLTALPDVDILPSGPRRSGAKANALLNGRLGGLRLLPRATFVGRMSAVAIGQAREPLDLETADNLVLDALTRHNSLIENKLRDSVGEDLVTGGTMHSALSRLHSAMV